MYVEIIQNPRKLLESISFTGIRMAFLHIEILKKDYEGEFKTNEK
jgi:hypothetical protein